MRRWTGSPAEAAHSDPLHVAALTSALYAFTSLPALSGLGVAGAGSHSLVVGMIATALLAAALVALSTIDTLTFELPDVLTLPLAAAGVALHLVAGPAVAAGQAVAALIGYAALAGLSRAYAALRGRAGLGLGDAKLLAAGAAWLGLAALPTVVALAAAAALVTVAVAWLRGGSLSLDARLPFGPYLALAIWLVWLHGPFLAAQG
jgi:leader peptidase (prepilin peptidase)/N-methyltransferase